MPSLIALFNRLIPFATPGTPLLQDVLHLLLLCAALYFGPHIQQSFQQRTASIAENDANGAPGNPDAGSVDRVEEDAAVLRDANQQRDGRQQHLAEEMNGAVRDFNRDDAGIVEPGPADAHPIGADDMARQRNVGAKKAKSLARKDQRRAYHEFMRAQGDSQRAKDAEGSDTREQALAAERERRKQAESRLEAQKASEREMKRRKDEVAREENAKRIDVVLQTIREELEAHRTCDLFRVARAVGEDVDEEWVEQVVRASGMVGFRNGTMTMITETGWVARVTMADMMDVYNSAVSNNIGDAEGRITEESINDLLVAILRQHSSIAAT